MGEIKSHNTSFRIEACVTTADQAVIAFENGAHRLEICQRLETEGMTPDFSLVEKILQNVSIPVRIMIRETEKGYHASESDLQKMIQSILELKPLPIEGYVIGVLKSNYIDRHAMKEIMDAASPKPITFHKAIDKVDSINSELVWLNQYPAIDTILTSGGAIFVLDGKEKIAAMRTLFHGEVMAGGKITADNLDAVHDELHLNWYHGRSITQGL